MHDFEREDSFHEAAEGRQFAEASIARSATLPQRGGNTEDVGAPLSNTAPANYTNVDLGNPGVAVGSSPDSGSKFRVLRFGIDSLYLSYPGTLSRQWEQRLEGLKLAAQAQEDREQAHAQVDIGGHLLEVSAKGQGRFPFLLADNCFRISLSRSDAQALPLAYAQVSSEMLTAIGADTAQERLRYIVSTLGKNVENASVSRADLFVDFLSTVPMDAWHASAWVTRAHRVDAYHVQRRFSGWAIGLGGGLAARLYDKTVELEKSHKDYLKPLWQAKGWQDGETVWRLEFEFKRPVLKELGVLSLPCLQAHLAGLWRYATNDWLRLAIPTPSDTNQTRWPTHPLWRALSSLDWDQPDAPVLSRLRKERLPHDEALFVNGLGAITSFMAREGITDFGEGFGEFLAHAERFHDHKGRRTGRGFRRYVSDKVVIKGRKYNTLRNESPDAEDERRAEADAYRSAKDGE